MPGQRHFGKTLDLQIFEQQSGSLPSVAGKRRLVEDERDRYGHCRGFDSRLGRCRCGRRGHCWRNGGRSASFPTTGGGGTAAASGLSRSVRASATMPSRFLIMFDVTASADRGFTGAAVCGFGWVALCASATRAAAPGGALKRASLASGLGIFSSVVNVHSPFSLACTVPISLPSAVIVTAELGSARPAKTDVPFGSMRATSKAGAPSTVFGAGGENASCSSWASLFEGSAFRSVSALAFQRGRAGSASNRGATPPLRTA